MHSLTIEANHPAQRRQRLHELLIALISTQEDLELMGPQSPGLESSNLKLDNQESARWFDKNRRILSKYQSLVRSAITLDALLDSEQIESV